MKTKNIFRLLLGLMIASFAHNSLKAQGCILDTNDYNKVPLAAPLMRGDFVGLPASFSMRKYAPIPKNQGSYGTCVGWTTAYATRTILLAIQNGWTDPLTITQNALSPYFVYERTKPFNDYDCQEGTTMFKALEELKTTGVIKYAEFNEICNKNITISHTQKASENKIKEYRRLFETGTPNSAKIQIIKKAVSESKPVMVGIECCRSSFLGAKGVDFWQPMPNEINKMETSAGHAVTVVAYDDNKYGGAFQIMNSWGTTWGNLGFIWVRYEDFANMCFEAYEMDIERKITSANIAFNTNTNNTSNTNQQTTTVNKFSGELRFELSAGYDMQAVFKSNYYEMKEPYHSGTLFRLYVSNNEPAYVYAIGSDMTKRVYTIFPNKTSISPYLAYSNNNLALPNENKYIKMDNTVGTDFFCFLYSSEKLDIDAIVSKLEYASGVDFYAKLKSVLGDKMLDTFEVNYNKLGKISFQAQSTTKKIVPLIVVIKHL